MEWWQTTVVIAAGVLTFFNLGDKIIAWIKDAKKPQSDLTERVEKLEKQQEFEYKALFADYEVRFKRDLERINAIEESNKLIIKSLLALMKHAEDGNNVDELKRASNDLQNYILNK